MKHLKNFKQLNESMIKGKIYKIDDNTVKFISNKTGEKEVSVDPRVIYNWFYTKSPQQLEAGIDAHLIDGKIKARDMYDFLTYKKDKKGASPLSQLSHHFC